MNLWSIRAIDIKSVYLEDKDSFFELHIQLYGGSMFLFDYAYKKDAKERKRIEDLYNTIKTKMEDSRAIVELVERNR